MRRSVLGLGSACLAGVGIAVAVAASSATTGCTTHQCDTDFVNIDQSTGAFVGDVHQITPTVAIWESSPLDGTWIDFPGQRTYFFSLPANFQPIQILSTMIATDATPDDVDAGGGTYAFAAGQLAQFGNFVNGGFLITNDSCAEYFLYVSVLGTVPAPAPDDAGTGD